MKRQNFRNKTAGEFSRGRNNAITDVPGVRAGHLTVNKDMPISSGELAAIRTGFTAVLPYDMKEEKRLFAGCSLLGPGNDLTGFEVTEDFCYLNSPIVLANAFNIGRVYNAILSYGFALGREEIWPPVVVGIDDSYMNDMTKFSVDESSILHLFKEAGEGPLAEGSIGIGTGLMALGWKTGVGTSSRILPLEGKAFTIGALAASNFGCSFQKKRKKESTDHSESLQGSFILILAADIPLVPHQIRSAASRLMSHLSPALWNPVSMDSAVCYFFSTANAMDMKKGGPRLFDFAMAADSILEPIVQAGTEASLEAAARTFLSASPIKGRLGRTADLMPAEEFQRIFGVKKE